MTLLDKVKLLVSNMQRAITDFEAIKTALVENGADMQEGTTTSEYPEKVNEVYENCKNALLPTMWSAIVGHGARSYDRAFYQLNLDNTTWKPTDSMQILSAISMFDNCSKNLEESKQVDESSMDEGLIFEGCTNAARTFFNCGLFSALKCVDFREITTSTNVCFTYSSIKRINEFYSPALQMRTTFSNATNLSYIGFCSPITNVINVQSCPLEIESAILLLQNLKDYTGTDNEFTFTVTLSEELWEKLDALGNVSPNGNTWREYCGDIGWNA